MRKLQQVETNYSDEYGPTYDLLIYVKAVDKQDALEEIYRRVSYASGRYNYAAYDCTGQWFSGAIRRHDVSWCKARKCYVAKQHWYMDV